jgi:hypothetical protein
MFAHASTRDTVFHFGNAEPDIGRTKLRKQPCAFADTARLNDTAQPNGQVFSQANLDAAHTFDAAD